MKSIINCLLATGVVLLAGCSSTPTRVNTGTVHASTFSFVIGKPASPDDAEKRAQVHKLIQDAITTDLASKGVTRVESGGNVIVAYLVILGDNVATTSVNDYFGYGRDADALLEKAHQKIAVDSKNPNPFVAGVLVVDVIDARTYKLLYRNYAVRQVFQNLSDAARAERMQEAVDQALTELRIAK